MGSNRKVVTIVGARPQFIKASTISLLLRKKGLQEIFVHTGQHYDYEMSQIFFDGLNLPKPDYNLGVGSDIHGKQTAFMLQGIEEILIKEKPHLAIVYGDTNSTLAGALAASKLRLPVAHIEAGLRSYDRNMPEEINRVLTDHISTLLFAPTKTAVHNLKRENIKRGVYLSGDVMCDLFLSIKDLLQSRRKQVLERYGLKEKKFFLATVHRAENTDNQKRWKNIIDGLTILAEKGMQVVLPAHPRIRKLLTKKIIGKIKIIDPLPYLETQVLISSSKMVITDSGGLQKEAVFNGTFCLVLRDRTEWTELLSSGQVVLVDDSIEKILSYAQKSNSRKNVKIEKYFGNGKSSKKIVNTILKYLN